VETSGRAVLIEIAVLVHGELKSVVLPAEDIVTVSGGATVIQLA